MSALPYPKESKELGYKAFGMFTNNHRQWCQTACPIRMLIPETKLSSAFRGEACLHSNKTLGDSIDRENLMAIPDKGLGRIQEPANGEMGGKILPSKHDLA